MSRMDHYRTKYLETASQHVGQPVEGIGIFSRPGAMGHMMLGKVSGLGYLLGTKSGKAKSGGLPQNVVIAVTADKVHVYRYKPSGTKLKLKDPLAVWERGQIRVEQLKEGMASARVRFHLPDGDSIELDSNRMPGSKEDFNAPLLELLSA